MAANSLYRQDDPLPPPHMIPFPSPHKPGTDSKTNDASAATPEILPQVSAASLFESAPDAMVLVNGDGRIVAVNTKTAKMFGYRREKLVGEPVEKLMPQWLQTGHVAHRSQNGIAPHALPMGPGLGLFGRHHDGHEFPVEISLSAVKTKSGMLVSSAIRDVTDLRHRQELQDRTEELSKQALAEQLRFETMLAEMSATFISLPADQLDGQIREGQKRICETLGLDRSTLAQLSEQKKLIITHSWAAQGLEALPALTQSDFPWMTRTLLSGQRVSFARIDDLPEEAATDKETLHLRGLKSNVTFPLSAGGENIGVLAFGSLRTEREWPAPLVDRLGMVAQIFANALSRARAERELKKAYQEIAELKQDVEKENLYLREEVRLEHHHGEVVGDSDEMRRVLQEVEQVAPTDSTVLVLGETGTGKELIAQTIHEHSRRKGRVMVKVNCAALPATLIESELFGREKGAFTGALTREMGRFELANGSTILLDEVGELPIELQSKLLRVLQEGEFERLGSCKTIKVDVRVIAATSRDLQQAVREGKFREDLFYRLNVFPITVPPLRDRPEDIPSLVWHFLGLLCRRMGRSIETVHSATMDAFKSYYWPGNVRELRNVIERFLITSTGTVFRAKLPPAEAAEAGARPQTFEEVERDYLLRIMEMVGWRVRGEGGAAQIMGLKPTTLESRMQKLGISRHK
jgi:formate hydrogenlyase transcriptional activator